MNIFLVNVRFRYNSPGESWLLSFTAIGVTSNGQINKTRRYRNAESRLSKNGITYVNKCRSMANNRYNFFSVFTKHLLATLFRSLRNNWQ